MDFEAINEQLKDFNNEMLYDEFSYDFLDHIFENITNNTGESVEQWLHMAIRIAKDNPTHSHDEIVGAMIRDEVEYLMENK